jgi:hypothetical protein
VILGAFCASNSFSSLLRFVFSFALGGCVSVFGAVVLLLRYLKKEQLKAARRKDDSLQIAQTSRLMQERRKNAESDMQSWAKLFPANPHSTSSELKNKEPSFLVLKSNLLFEFRDEKDPECLGVMCLDNALLSVNMTKKNLSRGDKWQKKNSIKVQKLPEQKSLSLNGGLELVYIYFSSARQLQVWFLALRRASKLCWKVRPLP